MPMLFWLPNIIFVGIWQAIEDDMRGLRDASGTGFPTSGSSNLSLREPEA